MTTWKRYSEFLQDPPELTIEWRDQLTDARGWLIINSLRGGATGGGTRMRPGVGPGEVTYLAKAMELKFALAGPPIGGAKAGIDFDPFDPRKPEVLARWYRAIRPYLIEHYGTAGDLGVDEVLDVIPAISRLGVGHPQEGIVRGHFQPDDGALAQTISNLQLGVEAPIEGDRGVAGVPMKVADLITGYGVALSIRHLYARQGRGLEGIRVLLEGFGNVGAAAGLFLARWGARIVGIADLNSVLLSPEGLDPAGVEELIRRRVEKLLPVDDPRIIPQGERARFFGTPAEVFVAAAASGSIGPERLDLFEANGIEVIASGANQPFGEAKLGSTTVARSADRRFTILPDILANCGMARTFSYLMEGDAVPEADPIFAAVDDTIMATLDEILERARGGARGLLAATLDLVLDRVGAP